MLAKLPVEGGQLPKAAGQRRFWDGDVGILQQLAGGLHPRFHQVLLR